jgi:hypothetical protein
LGIVLVSSSGLLPQLTSNLLCVSFWVLGQLENFREGMKALFKAPKVEMVAPKKKNAKQPKTCYFA